ncbi:MAG: sigma-70 family RNA polymerase sigma factor [Phycisphaerales bacterium]
MASGDANAVRECADQYGGLVWSLARRWSPTRADAEDAVQDVFVSVWRNAGRFDPTISQETTFIAMIARRRLIDRMRKAGRRPDEVALDEGSAQARADGRAGGSGVGAAEMGEDAARAEAAMRELSEEQQRVLRLSIVHGVSHEKIAASTGLPLGTVKTHIRRGLIKLRGILAEPEGVGVGAGKGAGS